eukprot:6200524-Pleurochrysis_carterae.AAC.1
MHTQTCHLHARASNRGSSARHVQARASGCRMHQRESFTSSHLQIANGPVESCDDAGQRGDVHAERRQRPYRPLEDRDESERRHSHHAQREGCEVLDPRLCVAAHLAREHAQRQHERAVEYAGHRRGRPTAQRHAPLRGRLFCQRLRRRFQPAVAARVPKDSIGVDVCVAVEVALTVYFAVYVAVCVAMCVATVTVAVEAAVAVAAAALCCCDAGNANRQRRQPADASDEADRLLAKERRAEYEAHHHRDRCPRGDGHAVSKVVDCDEGAELRAYPYGCSQEAPPREDERLKRQHQNRSSKNATRVEYLEDLRMDLAHALNRMTGP